MPSDKVELDYPKEIRRWQRLEKLSCWLRFISELSFIGFLGVVLLQFGTPIRMERAFDVQIQNVVVSLLMLAAISYFFAVIAAPIITRESQDYSCYVHADGPFLPSRRGIGAIIGIAIWFFLFLVYYAAFFVPSALLGAPPEAASFWYIPRLIDSGYFLASQCVEPLRPKLLEYFAFWIDQALDAVSFGYFGLFNDGVSCLVANTQRADLRKILFGFNFVAQAGAAAALLKVVRAIWHGLRTRN